jgi:predicted HAD superfamily hydrolase/GT2 family glycosyltransferase
MANFQPPFTDKSLWSFLHDNSYLSLQHKILYIATPKAACTTLKWWFASLEGYSKQLTQVRDSLESDPELVIHDNFIHVADDVTGLPPESLAGPITSDSFFRFALVRNPFTRLFSAWQSKLLLREPIQSGPYLDYDFFWQPVGSAEEIALAFEGFLKHLAAREAPIFWDVHWTPQVNLLRPDLIDYTLLVPLEKKDQLISALASHMGSLFSNPFAGEPMNTTLIPFQPDFLTPNSVKLIRDLFAEDFHTFKYDLEVPAPRKVFSASQLELALKAIKLIRGRHQRLAATRATMDQEVARRDDEIARYRQGSIELNEEVQRLNSWISEQDTKIGYLDQLIIQRDAQVSNLNELVAQSETHIRKLDQGIADLSQDIAHRTIEIDRLDQAIQARDRQIIDLDQGLGDRDAHIIGLSREIEQLDGSVTNLKRTLEEKSHQNRELVAASKTMVTQLQDTLLSTKKVFNWQRHFKRNYQEFKKAIVASALFDADWYLQQNPDLASAGIDPADHYLRHGGLEGRAPSTRFDSAEYLRNNPLVEALKINPLVHYLFPQITQNIEKLAVGEGMIHSSSSPENQTASSGPATGPAAQNAASKGQTQNVGSLPPKYAGGTVPVCTPKPSSWAQKLKFFLHRKELAIVAESGLFDADYYLTTNPDVAESSLDPMWHYLRYGVLEDRNPNPLFHSQWYLSQNQDVKQDGINPLVHFVTHGASEGRDPNPLFATRWYQEQNPDAIRGGKNPLAHYLGEGASHGRMPCPSPDMQLYFALVPELSDRDVNPLAHYFEYARQREMDPLGPVIPDSRPHDQRASAGYSYWLEVNHLNANRKQALARALGWKAGLANDSPWLSPFQEDWLSCFQLAIETVEIVCFDLFDTLVERQILHPTHLFNLLERHAPLMANSISDFAAQRIEAESRARSLSAEEEITLDDIYAELGRRHDISKAKLEELKAREIDFEMQYIAPKPWGVHLLDAARGAGKQVFLISDTYLDAQTIKGILDKCALGDFDRVYLSSDHKKTKHTGSLFANILRGAAVLPSQVMHVGDNDHSDIQVPAGLGIKTWRIHQSATRLPKPRAQFSQHEDSAHQPHAEDPAHSTIHGLIGNRLYCQPWLDPDKGKRFQGDPFRLGYATLGPLLLGWSLFIARKARRRGYKQLLFASRDSYFAQVAYDLLRSQRPELPPSHYFLSSRNLSYGSMIWDVNTVLEVADRDYFPTKLDYLLKNRLYLSDDDLHIYANKLLPACGFSSLKQIIHKTADHDKLLALVGKLAPVIIANCGQRRKTYREYIQSFGISQTPSAIVEIGYAGTAQKTLYQLSGKHLGGVYLTTSDKAKALDELGLFSDSFYKSLAAPDDVFFKYVQLFELFLSATHPSVVGIKREDNGQFQAIYSRDTLPASGILTMGAIHQGAIKFVADHLRFNGHLLAQLEIDPFSALSPLLGFFQHPSPEDCGLFAGMTFEDRFGAVVHSLTQGTQPSFDDPQASGDEINCWAEASQAFGGTPSNHDNNFLRIARGFTSPMKSSASLSSSAPPMDATPSDSFSEKGLHPSYEHDDWPASIESLSELAWSDAIRPQESVRNGVENRPFFSVILPVSRAKPFILQKALQSLLAQIYPLWELRLIHSRRTQDHVASVLKEMGTEGDSRVCVHVSGEENESALAAVGTEMAAGRWLFFLDQYDQLAPEALAEMATAILAESKAHILYSDEDKIYPNGERGNPEFKPDFSPEMLLSRNLLGRSMALSTDLYHRCGGVRPEAGDSWRHDLALAATGLSSQVAHLPRILVHQGDVLPGHSPEGNGLVAVEAAIKRRDLPVTAQVDGELENAGYRACSLSFPDTGPQVAILIPSKNNWKDLKLCLDSLAKTTYQNYSVHIIDNGYDDPDALAYFASCEHQVLPIASPPTGFSFAYINNQAADMVEADYLLFLNDDTEVVSPGWLSQMAGWLGLPGVGAVGARLYFPDGHLQHAGIVNQLLYGLLPAPAFKMLEPDDPGYQGYAITTRNCSAVTAACMITPKKLFAEMGGFNEADFAVAYNDCDYGFRLHRAGWRNVYCSDAVLFHHEGATRGVGKGNDDPAEEAAFIRKYGDWGDPFYNANLATGRTDFSIQSRVVISGSVPPLRALMVSHNLEFEGAPLIQLEVAKGLQASGEITPLIVSPLEGPLRSVYEQLGIQVEVWERFSPFNAQNPQEYSQGLASLEQVCHELEPDLVFANTVLSFWAIDMATRMDLPSIWTIHESEPPFHHLLEHQEFLAEIGRQCLEMPYKVVFVADSTREVFRDLESRNNFFTIHNGFDPARLESQTREFDRIQVRKGLGVEPDEIMVFLPEYTAGERRKWICWRPLMT